MNIKLPNSRMKNINLEGGIIDVLEKADALARHGRKIIHLEIGRPDFDSPLCAKQAAKAALDRGDVHYTSMGGTLALRTAIAEKTSRENGIDIDPETEVVVTTGAQEANLSTFMCLLEPGDEVLIPTPLYSAYPEQLSMLGVKTVTVPTYLRNDFRLKIDDLKKAVTSKTKLLILNSPNNPTGSVLTSDDLKNIARFVIDNDIMVMSDECYEQFNYDGTNHSIISLPGMKERTILLCSASKTFSMTGWRVGWAIMPAQLRKYVVKAHEDTTACANSFAQAGVAEALKAAWPDVKAMVDEYKKRRDLVIDRLTNMDGIDFSVPHGAFYVFPSIKKLHMSSKDFCNYMLEEAGIALVPGDSFLPVVQEGPFFRLAYCRSIPELNEAMDKMATALNKIKR
jgi:aspartate/methionine/tyrosine aminotransferase